MIQETNLIKTLTFICVLFTVFLGHAQIDNTEFAVPKKYVVAGITVLGSESADVQTIKLFAGIKEGDKILIPGEKITKAIQNLWDQDLFSDVQIGVAEVRGESAYLVIEVKERSLLEGYSFHGISKSEANNVRDDIDLQKNRIVNENLLNNTRIIVKNYFLDKGYLKTRVTIEKEELDSALKRVNLKINVNKGNRVKINEINIEGLTAVKENKLKKKMKDTKEKHWYRLFKRSKFKKSDYKTDRKIIVETLNKKGYRNAKLEFDTTYFANENSLNIDIKVKEGNRFYFRNVSWLGNTKYETRRLDNRLGISEGDIYDKSKLSERLFGSPNGNDVSSLYLDNGYLSFNANPVEVLVENDSIDIEVRIYEGKQYRVNKVIISGNSMTNEHVIRREIRTRPGDLFSRSDIIRTQRELSQLGYFDPAGFEVNPQQNPTDGTVDIEYVVAEKPSDQIELQGGWGNGRIVGTLALSFNNFSMRKAVTKSKTGSSHWAPVPRGDGQRLSLRAQSNGIGYQSYSLSFLEPWMGGKKPNSFSVSASHSVLRSGQKFINNSEGDRIRNPDDEFMKIYGGSVGFGARMKVPDDYFQFFASVNYQHYLLQNYRRNVVQNIDFDNGSANNLSATLSLYRDSRSGNPIFQTGGSKIGATLQVTPPWSKFNKLRNVEDFSEVSEQDIYKWIEYHKWKFTAEWYNPLSPSGETSDSKFVLFTKVGIGFLGTWNNQIGTSPFERFYLGGSPLSGFQFDGREIISLRGYDDNSLSSDNGDSFINKYTMELRYLLSPSPSATIYALGFLEAGDSWSDFKDFDPFGVKRSGGVGMRLFLPMFGLLGLDYGWRFDDVFNQPGMPQGQFHFTIGTNLGEL
ncbi:MAG: outer membrane protein insertion porin family [Patiriisocius sp.]|jgi:outer membrane protein insertion porin family